MLRLADRQIKGPVRPGTDEAFFRKTGISGPRASGGGGDKGKGKSGDDFENVEGFACGAENSDYHEGI